MKAPKKRAPYKPKTMSDKAIAANKANAAKGGRPKGSIGEVAKMQREMRKILTEKAREKFGDLMQAQIDLALGVWVEETETKINASGEPEVVRRVYRRPPSNEAIKHLMDQAVGRARESIDLSVTKEGSLTLEQLELIAQGRVDEAFADSDDETEDEG